MDGAKKDIFKKTDEHKSLLYRLSIAFDYNLFIHCWNNKNAKYN